MPFNGSGTFSIVNTFVPNTTILSAAVNQNFTDIATGLSDCLTRDGQAGMTAVLKLISGSSGAPSLSFTADTKTGAYLPATGVLGLVANALGVKVNSEVFAAASMVPSVGGSGYAVGDTVYGPTANAIVPFVATVATLSGSAIATVTVTVPGIYITKPTNPVTPSSTSGAGTSATFTVTWNDPTSSDYKLGITDLSDAALWTKLGASSYVAGILGKANGTDFFKAQVTPGTGLSLTSGTLSAPAFPPTASFKNLAIKVASNTTVNVTADFVTVSDGTNFRSVAINSTGGNILNLGSNGAVNRLDAGTIAVSTWYAVFAIASADGVSTGTLASTSATSPTLPTGYTLFARIGWVRTISGSATLYGTWQFARAAQYVVGLAQTTIIPNIANGAAGTVSSTSPTLAAVSVSNFVPTTASRISVLMASQYLGNATAGILVAPNTSWGGTNNGPSGSAGMLWPIYNGNIQASFMAILTLEATTIAWASTGAGGAISCLGWEDNI